MSRRKLSEAVFGGILVMLVLVGCGAPAPTPAPAPPTLTSTPIPSPTFTTTFTPTPVPSLSGRVTDAGSGEGIAGAKVEIQMTGYGWDYSATTNPDGSYGFFSLPTGDYKLRVTASGYAREYYNNVNPSHEAMLVHVVAGQWTSNVDFDLTEGGSISGTIYQQDGVTPISGARVFVRPSKYSVEDGFQTITTADGSYHVDGLSLGSYKITVESSGYAALKYYDDVYGWNDATSIDVTPPDNTPNINIRLDPPGSISGHIYQSDGTTPVGNVQIIADTTTGGWEGVWIMSNNDGSYTLDGLPPSRYILRVQNWIGLASEYYNGKASFQTANILSVAIGQQVTGIDFTLKIGAPISGKVYDNATGVPISGASISVSLVKGQGFANVNVPTLPDGSYVLWMGNGCYTVGIGGLTGAPGYVPEYWNNHYDGDNADWVCVTAPTGAAGIDFYLAHAGSISGHVYEKDGTTPLPGASVYAFPVSGDHPGAGANTEADGSYTIQGLPSGNYRIQVTASGHVTQFYNLVTDEASATEVTVKAPGDTPGIDFSLSPVSE
ncbi:MAG: carboxypeptidase regulatory-like domain-containing protein [Anaerolineales bacterium]|nr:carboxypeptidase regulatory-like domain-containing protein [Anaerolineales bacterium]